MLRCLRNAPPLAVTPTQSATVLVAFAGMGATPVKSNAGNAIKLPPPATAFSAPPSPPAKNRKMMVWSVKDQFVPKPPPAGTHPARKPVWGGAPPQRQRAQLLGATRHP